MEPKRVEVTPQKGHQLISVTPTRPPFLPLTQRLQTEPPTEAHQGHKCIQRPRGGRAVINQGAYTFHQQQSEIGSH